MNKQKKPSPKMGKAKEKYPHFRFLKYKEGPQGNKRKHPKLILEREDNTYHYMGMTESPKRGRHANIKLSQNPKRGDERPAYIRREYLIRPTKDFQEERKDYRLAPEDYPRVMKEAEKLRAKKKK